MPKKKNLEKLIEDFKSVHSDKYSYHLVNYINDNTKIKIFCFKHGEFLQKPKAHFINKSGCPKCAIENRNEKNKHLLKKTENELYEKIKEKFGNEFDLSHFHYEGVYKKCLFICKKCGTKRKTSPRDFLDSKGCINCTKKVYKNGITLEKFLQKAKEIHGEKYDYSNIEYKGLQEKVKIICKIHGEFEQRPAIHIYAKSNCPECKTSKGEEAIGIFLNNNNISYNYQYKIRIDNSNHYFDFYVESKNLLIEFNGLQHYKPIKFWNGEKGLEYTKLRDKIKKDYCEKNKINFLIIKFDDDIHSTLKKYLDTK